MMAVGYVMFPSAIGSAYGILYAIGAAIFSLVSMSIAFLVGSLIKSNTAISGITNVVSLGMSFLCGVFVPQQLLGESVINLSKTLPAYWYINANDQIVKLTDFSLESIQPILNNWVITLAFAVVLFIVAYIVRRISSRRA